MDELKHGGNAIQNNATNKEEEQYYLKEVLSKEQIQTFLDDGILVIDNIILPEEVKKILERISYTLLQNSQVDTNNLLETGHGLTKLSSTNGSGGVLDCFYNDYQLEMATNANLFVATTQLWEAAFCSNNESIQDLSPNDKFRWHPYGKFNCKRGYCYFDRIGYRVPTKLATTIGAKIQTTRNYTTNTANVTNTNPWTDQEIQKIKSSSQNKQRKQKSLAIQRSLTPHLDCCPDTFHLIDGKSKWRPIQCFISLTDAVDPNMGGFEGARGFHKEFYEWAKTRAPTIQITKKKQEIGGKPVVKKEEVSIPAPCIGEYTHIRPVEDSAVMKRVQHVPARAGSAVFFDNRIPHSNAYRHDGESPRVVLYTSFLPDVPINRKYAAEQLAKWRRGEPPNDQWIGDGRKSNNNQKQVDLDASWLDNPLSKKLLGIDPW